MRNILLLSVLMFFSLLMIGQSLSLRRDQQQHNQIGTFADVINNSNHVSLDASIIPGTPSSNTTSAPPKVSTGLIIGIICAGLCFIFCIFCFKCARNQQKQAQAALQQTIPCYCGPCKLICKCCKYLLCIDILLRCLGLRSTNWQKQQKERLEQEQKLKKKQQKLMKKQQKSKMKQQKYTNPNQANPYDTSMRRQNQLPNSIWRQVPPPISNMSIPSDKDKVKHEKCGICMGKVKKHCNIMTNCSQHCVFHLQCLIDYKKNNKTNINACPHCKSNYFNIVRFYCQKCWNQYTEMTIQSGNVYGSQLDYNQALKSIGGEKCDSCQKKKWFWQ